VTPVWKPRNPLSGCRGPQVVSSLLAEVWVYVYPTEPRGLTTNAFLLRIPPMSEDGIEYLDVLPLLRGAITTFARSVESAAVDPDNGEYVNITHLVRHLIGRLAAGQTEEFPAVFAVVERVLADGDEEALSLMVAGFFEDLLNVDEYTDTICQPSDFGPWLGPRARRVHSVASVLRIDD
jgi:hypothetical protein